ncbi:MAG: FecR family protein [Mangrovibacterium sp.]
MKNQYDDNLLATYFSGKINGAEKQAVEAWRDASDENRIIFKNAEKVWQSLNLLQEMRQYNTDQALLKVNKKTEKTRRGFIFFWQRVAAILLLPLLILGGIYFYRNNLTPDDAIVWQTITTPSGVKSQVQLPDGTMVWLNSGSSLHYPSSFTNKERNVKLSGEAFFEVVKDEQHPFHVNLGKISIEVLGTTFNVINYENEDQTEIILTSGKVRLLGQQKHTKQLITEMQSGQKAVYLKAGNKLSMQKVDTDKYTSWIDGRLIFRDDAMDEVIRRLNRWFNVEIEMADPGIVQYVYTATFQDETIEQILALLRRTAPIEYTIIPGKRLYDGSFEKQKIILKKR